VNRRESIRHDGREQRRVTNGVPSSKIPQKNFKNSWQRFQKNLAKTSKKDDKQKALTSLEVWRAVSNEHFPVNLTDVERR
jgi:hypothetical protein